MNGQADTVEMSLLEFLFEKAKFYVCKTGGTTISVNPTTVAEISILFEKTSTPEYAVRCEDLVNTLLEKLRQHLEGVDMSTSESEELAQCFEPLLDRNGRVPAWRTNDTEEDVCLPMFYSSLS